MTVYLPKNLAGLAQIAATEADRHALGHVRVLECQGDWYRCEATDGRRLAIVCGPSRPAPVQLPEPAGVPGADGPMLVPAAAWTNAFRQLPRGGALALLASESEVVFATATGLSRTPAGEGCFPAVEQVLPRCGPLVQVALNPQLLASLCQLALAIDPEGRRLDLLFYGPNRPLGLMAKSAEGQTFDALLMPMS